MVVFHTPVPVKQAGRRVARIKATVAPSSLWLQFLVTFCVFSVNMKIIGFLRL